MSIAAELIQCRRKDMPRRSGSTVLVEEDIDLPLIESLSRSDEPRALLIVLETSGLPPVKSGAMMAADHNFQSIGTIGGGCSEHSVLTEAHRLVGTTQSRCVHVDMGNDVAEAEEMVCGGQMKVLIQGIGG